jgi:nitrogen fixation-related uncharacterized protein
VWRSAATFRAERAKASTWILTLVHRRAVDLVRREERRQAEPLTDDSALGTAPEATDEAAWLRFERERVQTALKQLPDTQREALELAYYGGFSQSELAERLGVPLGTIKSRMFAGSPAYVNSSTTPPRKGHGNRNSRADRGLRTRCARSRRALRVRGAPSPAARQCQRELETFWLTTRGSRRSRLGPRPSAALRERILADVHTEPRQKRRSPGARRGAAGVVPILAAAAAIAAVVALAAGLWASDISGQLDDTRSALERAQSAAAVPRETPTRVRLHFRRRKTAADSWSTPDGEAVLVVDDLDPAPAGNTYEMWIMPGGSCRGREPRRPLRRT